MSIASELAVASELAAYDWSPGGQHHHDRKARFRFAIKATDYVQWKFSRHFPNIFPLFFVTGYPKSGTTWSANIAAATLQLPYIDTPLIPVAAPAVVHSHIPPTPKDQRGIYVVRDPRPTLVSLMLYEGSRGRLGGDGTGAEFLRGRLPAFIDREFNHPTSTQGSSWAEHVENGLASGLQLWRYEWLHEGNLEIMAQCLARASGAKSVSIEILEAAANLLKVRRNIALESPIHQELFHTSTQSIFGEIWTSSAEAALRRHAGPLLDELGYLGD